MKCAKQILITEGHALHIIPRLWCVILKESSWLYSFLILPYIWLFEDSYEGTLSHKSNFNFNHNLVCKSILLHARTPTTRVYQKYALETHFIQIEYVAQVRISKLS